MRAVAYCRVSTEDQQDRKTIENQVEFATKYTELHEIKLIKVYKDDGISGTIPFEDREGGRQLLHDAKNKDFDTLLIYKLDRLGRSARVTLNTIYELEQRGIKIKSMTEPFDTESPSGRFMITMLAGVADLERSTILERMQYGTDKAAREGKWLGGIIPYGYIVNKQGFLEVDEEKMACGFSEADVVRKVFNMLAIEKLSTFKIADFLNDKMIPTHYGKAGRTVKKGVLKLKTDGVWRPNGIANFVKNSVYKGVHEYGKRGLKTGKATIKRNVPAIVTEDIFDLAQKQLTENRNLAKRNTKNREYLLKGIIKCGYCQRTYIGTTYRKGKNAKGENVFLPYYLCTGKSSVYRYFEDKQCIAKSVRADIIESYIWKLCLEMINNPLTLKRELEVVNSKIKADNNIDYTDEIEKLINAQTKTENEKQNILLLYRKELISFEEAEKHLKEIEATKKALNDKIEVTHKKQTQIMLHTANVESFKNTLDKYRHSLEDIDFNIKREVVISLINKVIVYTRDKPRDTKIDVEYSFFSGVFS